MVFKSYFPNATTIKTTPFGSVYYHRAPKKLFIGQTNCSLSGVIAGNVSYLEKIYFPATSLANYMVANNWATYSIKQVGIIDNAEVYKTNDYEYNYPKLTGIDTEANIQLLTPAEDSLYLASDTGNLWQYDSANSQWVNTFSGYTPTWYSDEDCTTTVLPIAMDTTHTY